MTERKRHFVTPGIPDRCFYSEGIPLTKEEVRCVTLCKARLAADSVVYDIGAGTGSIAVEAALLAPRGAVYAVEKEPRAVETIWRNAAKFGVTGNLHVVRGEAPGALAGLPTADRVIIGGSGGRLKDILPAAYGKLQPGGRLVVNAVTLETPAAALLLLEQLGASEVEACCLTVARLARAGHSNIMKGMNPVFIITGRRPAQGGD